MTATQTIDFTLAGSLYRHSDLRKSGDATSIPHRWTRPMAGWLTVFGLLGASGDVIPLVDRDNQVFEAARQIGHIDWRPYVEKGVWNDTHLNGKFGRPRVIVGYPDTLEFHDGTSARSLSEGKVGFWTEGHLLDRGDPASWNGREPTPGELDRADYYWTLGQALKDGPRTLGLSADGGMLLSPCGKRILFACIEEAAVCEYPKNPGATLEPMEKALRQFRPGMVGASPCGRCCCPTGVCNRSSPSSPDSGWKQYIHQVQERGGVDTYTALRWIANHRKGAHHGAAHTG